MSDDPAIAKTREWIDKIVIGLDLCPFAAASIAKRGLRIVHCRARTEEDLSNAVADELGVLESPEGRAIDGSLLVHPEVLTDFTAYNQFQDHCDALLDEMSLVGEFQIASFHPSYRFADTAEIEAGNYTNRSPFPMLHLLRESSVSRAVESHPDPAGIPGRNVRRLEALGVEAIRELVG